jgi:hypothetical protein
MGTVGEGREPVGVLILQREHVATASRQHCGRLRRSAGRPIAVIASAWWRAR